MNDLVNADIIIGKYKNQKINYDKVLKDMINIWSKNNEIPSIILHSCCAPCSTYTLEFLSAYADITIFFSNSNIHPKSEYLRRSNEQKEFIENFNKSNNRNVKYIEDEYKPQEFNKLVLENNLKDELEGGKRCVACFNMRLDKVASYAKENGYQYFGSALTLSPKKNSKLINELGLEMQKIYNTNYLPSDFKKNKGYERSIEMCKEYDIYRQCYCGCIFAANKQGIDLKEVNSSAIEYLRNRNLK